MILAICTVILAISLFAALLLLVAARVRRQVADQEGRERATWRRVGK